MKLAQFGMITFQSKHLTLELIKNGDQVVLTPLKGESLNIDKVKFIVWGKPSQVNCNA